MVDSGRDDLSGWTRQVDAYTMRAPSTAALLVLASLCFDTKTCLAESQQDPLKESKAKDKYKAACPAYEQYARFSQYEIQVHMKRSQRIDRCLANLTARDY
jgi:hypothetical protein